MMVSGLNAAIQGIEWNRWQFAAQAEKISRAGLDDSPPDNLPKTFIDLKEAQRGLEANFAVLRAADEMVGTLIDILA